MDVPAALLLVDDDRMILHTLQEQLAREPYQVVTASNVKAGLGAISSQQFAIILADQTMPDMPGIEFLRKCRELQPRSSRMLIGLIPSCVALRS